MHANPYSVEVGGVLLLGIIVFFGTRTCALLLSQRISRLGRWALNQAEINAHNRALRSAQILFGFGQACGWCATVLYRAAVFLRPYLF